MLARGALTCRRQAALACLLPLWCPGGLVPAPRLAVQGPRRGRRWGLEASGKLARLALTAPDDELCFWTRGIVPAHWLQVAAPATEDGQVLLGDLSFFSGKLVILFTDGSGGPFSSDPLLRLQKGHSINYRLL